MEDSMTDIQELRALLAEARPILWLHRPSSDTDCGCSECRAIVAVVARIDAALAEPVTDDFKRGAKAMREAAGTCLWEYYDAAKNDPFLIESPVRIRELAERLDALPIPGDKP
jgi:hypothetical protein